MNPDNCDVGMRRICERLQDDLGLDLSSMTALEFFARDGSWQTAVFANLVKEVHAWEIDSRFEKDLIANLPENSKVRIGDSYQIGKEQAFERMFDMIVFDNPQGCYGEKYCEHFDALDYIPFLGKEKTTTVVFNVKLSPYDFYSDENKAWRERRASFYGLDDTSNLELNFVTSFYKNYFKSMGLEVSFLFSQSRPQESDLFYVVAGLTGAIN